MQNIYVVFEFYAWTRKFLEILVFARKKLLHACLGDLESHACERDLSDFL